MAPGQSLGRQVVLVPWEEGGAGGDVLMMAPYELSEREREAALSARQWSWVHLRHQAAAGGGKDERAGDRPRPRRSGGPRSLPPN